MPCHISVPILTLPSHCGVPHNHLPILHPNNTSWLSSLAPVDNNSVLSPLPPYLVTVCCDLCYLVYWSVQQHHVALSQVSVLQSRLPYAV